MHSDEGGIIVTANGLHQIGRAENLLEQGRLGDRLEPTESTRSTTREEQKGLFENSERHLAYRSEEGPGEARPCRTR